MCLTMMMGLATYSVTPHIHVSQQPVLQAMFSKRQKKNPWPLNLTLFTNSSETLITLDRLASWNLVNMFSLPVWAYLKVQQRLWSGWRGWMCWCCWWQPLWIQPRSCSPPSRTSSQRRSAVWYPCHLLRTSRRHTPPQGSAWEHCSSWSVPLGSWRPGSCLVWRSRSTANAFLERERERVERAERLL